MKKKLRDKAAASEAELTSSMRQEFEKEFSNTLVSRVSAEIDRQLDAAADEAELLIS